MKLFALYSIVFFTSFLFCFVNFFSSTTKHDYVFFANVNICDFLQLVYKMIKVKTVPVDFLYPPTKFGASFSEHPV